MSFTTSFRPFPSSDFPARTPFSREKYDQAFEDAEKQARTIMIVGISVFCVFVCGICGLAIYIYRKRARSRRTGVNVANSSMIPPYPSSGQMATTAYPPQQQAPYPSNPSQNSPQPPPYPSNPYLNPTQPQNNIIRY